MSAKSLPLATLVPFVLAAALLVTIRPAPAAPGGTYQAWVRHREASLKDPSLARLYTFDEGTGATGDEIPNLAGKDGPLSYGVAGSPGGPLAKIEGRWPEKKAVRLDRGFLHAPPFEVAGKSFTVAAWLRTDGPGAIRGDAVPMGGTLLSAGIGFWDGWRVTMLYPDRVIGFEIGRPKPSTSFGIRTGTVADAVWHHIAATWDGKRTRIYVDGVPAAQGDYAGDYTPPAPGSQFRIGFAGFGWGSAKLDVDEVAIYERTLSATEILRHALFHAPVSDAVAVRLEAGAQAIETGDNEAAAAEFEAAANVAEAPPDVVAFARLRRGQALFADRRSGPALAELASVLDTPNLPEGLLAMALSPLEQLARQTADAPTSVYETLLQHAADLQPREVAQLRLNLARRYAQEGKRVAAQAQFEEVLGMTDLTPREKANALLQSGHVAARAHDLEGARERYSAVLETGDAPAQFRSLAQLCIARAYLHQEDYARARSAYQVVQDLEGVPPSHVWEAQECLRELERIEAGLPARDPAWSRVELRPWPKPGLELYVAPNGSDENPGTKQRPFATLERARDAIRVLRANDLPPGGVAVNVAPGAYSVTDTLKLESQDSGTQTAPIVYRSEQKGAARFTGGVAVNGFRPVTDPALLSRLPEEAHGKVMQVDLKAQGITDYGELVPRGMGRQPAPVLELFFDGKPMRPARWPNEGSVTTGKVVDLGSKAPPRGAVFEYEGDRPERWQQAKDIWLLGYWRWLWADDTLPVASIDTQARQIRTAQTTAYGEIVQGAPYYAFNLLEEIDRPGEWYLDRATGILYLYPPSDPAVAEVQLSMLSVPFVQMDDVSWVILEGLSFELGRFDGVVINGGEHCLAAACTICRSGGTGVTINEGRSHGVLGCDIHTLGRNGTWVKGGDRKTLTPGGHFVENCHIYDFSRVQRTYAPAVWTDGVGNRFAHNRMHGSPGHAMRIEGNDHVIEFNEVFDVVRETDDQGGLDMWFNPTYRGNVIRYNFWRDIGNDRRCGQAGIRLDDAISGTLVYGNVFYRCSTAQFGAVQIHGGKENVIENNLFIDCKYGLSFSGWGADRWKQFLAGERVVKATTEDVDITKPPYTTRYPALADLAEDEGVSMAWRNVVYNCGAFLTRDRGIQDLMDNHVTMQDPGFVDGDKLNFALRPDSPLRRGGSFRPIPFNEIGLYRDELRASWPPNGGAH